MMVEVLNINALFLFFILHTLYNWGFRFLGDIVYEAFYAIMA